MHYRLLIYALLTIRLKKIVLYINNQPKIAFYVLNDIQNNLFDYYLCILNVV